MKYHIEHITRYNYNYAVRQSVNKCIMKPINDDVQQCLDYHFTLSPETNYFEYTDYWGNEVFTFYIWDNHSSLVVKSEAVIELSSELHRAHIMRAEEHADKHISTAMQNDYAEFLAATDVTAVSADKLHAISQPIWEKSRSLYDYVNAINHFIYTHFMYNPVSTTVDTKVSEFLDLKRGVCQDYAHLMLALCRYQRIPARYVSGYIYSGIDEKEMRGSAATHAWVEVMLPDLGWVGFDPTNNSFAHDQHIRVAVGRDYRDIVPIKGVYNTNHNVGSHVLEVEVHVDRM